MMCARRDSLVALGRQIDSLTRSLAAVMAEPEAPQPRPAHSRALVVITPAPAPDNPAR